MVTIEQKLAEFQKIIEEKVDSENKALIEAKKSEVNESMAKVEKEFAEQYERNKKMSFERLEKQKQEKLSALIQTQRREQLKSLEGFLQKIVNDVEEKFKTFVISEEYPEFAKNLLQSTLKNIKAAENDTILVRIPPQNYEKTKAKLMEVLESYGNARVIEGDINFIGGFVIELPEKSTRINKTIQLSIEERKDDIGQYIQSYIQGGAN